MLSPTSFRVEFKRPGGSAMFQRNVRFHVDINAATPVVVTHAPANGSAGHENGNGTTASPAPNGNSDQNNSAPDKATIYCLTFTLVSGEWRLRDLHFSCSLTSAIASSRWSSKFGRRARFLSFPAPTLIQSIHSVSHSISNVRKGSKSNGSCRASFRCLCRRLARVSLMFGVAGTHYFLVLRLICSRRH